MLIAQIFLENGNTTKAHKSVNSKLLAWVAISSRSVLTLYQESLCSHD